MRARTAVRLRRVRRGEAAPADSTAACKTRSVIAPPNPFLQANAVETVQHVKCGLKLYVQLSAEGMNAEFDEDIVFGQYLFLQSMVDALEAAKAQITNERKASEASRAKPRLMARSRR